jgi:hypothetical protein
MNGEERRGNKERKKERKMRKIEKTKNQMKNLYCH